MRKIATNNMKVCIGVVSSDYIRSKTVATLLSLVKKYDVDVIIETGCLVHINRNKIVARALKGDYTHLFFVDSDMCFDAGVLERLLANKKDIVGTNYNKRAFPIQSTVIMKGKYGNFFSSNSFSKELFKVYSVGTGCLLIKLSVFDKIEKPYFFFETGKEDVGEDVWFCRKASKAGFNIWCDPTVDIGHLGEYIF